MSERFQFVTVGREGLQRYKRREVLKPNAEREAARYP